VLPGPAEASPPNRPKITAIWGKHTANSNFNQIPLLFRYFLTFIPFKNKNKRENLSSILFYKHVLPTK
jgi:hypothetical protein